MWWCDVISCGVFIVFLLCVCCDIAIFAALYITKAFYYIMKQKEFHAELRAKGCVLVRHGANHDIWFSPITGRKWAIPRHGGKEMALGTERRARKELGLD